VASFLEANLCSANLEEADLADANIVKGSTRWDEETHWPDGYTPPS
jgi:hypothetical protein